MDGGNTLVVTTEELTEKALEFQAVLGKAKRSCRKLYELAKGTDNCFSGRAAETFRKKMSARVLLLEEQIEKMYDFAGRLMEAAEEYSHAEGENKDVITGNRSTF